MKTLRKLIAALLVCCMALPLAACGEVQATEKQLFAMNSAVSIKAYGKNAEAGLNSAASVISALDASLDPEREGSTLYNINSAAGDGIVITGQVAEMLQTARTVYDATDGALDLSVYPLVKAWGFIDGLYNVPSESEIDSLLEHVDFSAVNVSAMTETDTYLLTMPAGMELTFAAVARGCAAMYAMRAMRQAGVESGIVSFGGTVMTLGVKPDGSGWVVGLQDPVNTGSYAATLNVGADTAVVTSGGYLRYFVDDDGNYRQHILDPATGYPAESDLLSVTVICDDGTYADALSTALYVMGERDAKSFYEDNTGFELVFITNDNRVVVSEGVREDFTLSGSDYTVETLRRPS